MSKTPGNGQAGGQPTKGILQRILGRASSERTQQAAFKRTHDAIETARQRRVRAQRERKERGGK